MFTMGIDMHILLVISVSVVQLRIGNLDSLTRLQDVRMGG